MPTTQLSATASPIYTADGGATATGPVADVERNRYVDTVRGMALLGILLLNVSGFALAGAGYYDGSIGSNGLPRNYVVWFVSQMFFEGKMRALFSMLFGAGVILLTRRGESRGQPDVADIYYRRNLWLIGFGVVDAFLLLWPADVLYDYGVCGLLLYPLRKVSPRVLLVTALVVLGVLVGKDVSSSEARAKLAASAAAAHQRFATTQVMTKADRATIRSWATRLAREKPDTAALESEARDRRAGYLANVRSSIPENVDVESRSFYLFRIWDILPMMLIGMALLQLGFLTGELPLRTYVLVAIAGYAIAIPVNWWATNAFMNGGFVGAALLDSRNQPGRLVMAVSHAALVIACVKAGLFRGVTTRLAAVGQMALSNYLMQTVICDIVFTGIGFGLFGRLDRTQLLGLVIAIWVVQLTLSQLWLRRFRFGPVEWLWRSLTYVRMQPMRRS